jgi:hypothetical protein
VGIEAGEGDSGRPAGPDAGADPDMTVIEVQD